MAGGLVMPYPFNRCTFVLNKAEMQRGLAKTAKVCGRPTTNGVGCELHSTAVYVDRSDPKNVRIYGNGYPPGGMRVSS